MNGFLMFSAVEVVNCFFRVSQKKCHTDKIPHRIKCHRTKYHGQNIKRTLAKYHRTKYQTDTGKISQDQIYRRQTTT